MELFGWRNPSQATGDNAMKLQLKNVVAWNPEAHLSKLVESMPLPELGIL